MCGPVGCFAVLRRRALLGDVLAHAALPGIGIAFWITRSKTVPILLLGALVTGLLGVWAIAYTRDHTRTKPDAIMSLVLSVFFGAGVAISRHIQNVIPNGSKAGLDTYILGKTAGIVASDVYLLSAVSLLAILIIVLLFKEFRLVTFDPHFAKFIGWKVVLLDFLMMSLIATSVIVGLPMVGVVMIAAMVLLPAMIARFWTDNLITMLFISSLAGILSASSGVILSSSFSKMPTGPIIILCAGAFFLISALFAPKRGLVAKIKTLFDFRRSWGLKYFLINLQKHDRMSKDKAIDVLKSSGILSIHHVIRYAVQAGHVRKNKKSYSLTKKGENWLKEQGTGEI